MRIKFDSILGVNREADAGGDVPFVVVSPSLGASDARVLAVTGNLTLTDDGSTLTLDTIQGIRVTDSPIFAGLNLTGDLVIDDRLVAPTGKTDGFLGTAYVGVDGRIYFWVGGQRYYVSGTLDPENVPQSGSFMKAGGITYP